MAATKLNEYTNADYTLLYAQNLSEKNEAKDIKRLAHGDGYVEPIKPINAEKDAASEVFMSNYNDDQVFQPNFDEALNNEILNTTDKDLREIFW